MSRHKAQAVRRAHDSRMSRGKAITVGGSLARTARAGPKGSRQKAAHRAKALAAPKKRWTVVRTPAAGKTADPEPGTPLPGDGDR